MVPAGLVDLVVLPALVVQQRRLYRRAHPYRQGLAGLVRLAGLQGLAALAVP